MYFTYLDSYAGKQVRNHVVFKKNDLSPGKWFYLKAPKVFLEKILPKLVYRLEDFADVRFGIKTGANEFFYMKDISHFYETDRLANPGVFDKLKAKAETAHELKNQGLAYMENEEGERLIIERKSVKPLLRSIRNFTSPLINVEPSTYCLALGSAIDKKGSNYTARYITSGESKAIEVTRGAKRKKVVGYHSLSTTKARPIWYVLPSLKPAHIALPELFFTRMLNFYSKTPLLADHLFDVVYPHKNSHNRTLWLYLNSTVYFTMLELWSPKMGGGALHPRTTEYKAIPTPDIEALVPNLENLEFGNRETLPYDEEIRQSDKIALDNAVLRGMGFKAEDADRVLHELYESYVEMLQDRLIKAGKMVTENVDQIAEENAEGEA